MFVRRAGRLGFVQPPIIDRELAVACLLVNLHESFVETNVAPRVILLTLHRGGNDCFDANHRGDKTCVALAQSLDRFSKKRTRLIDGVPECQRSWKNNQPIEVKFERIEFSKTIVFHDCLIAHEHDAKLGLHHAVMAQVCHPEHESWFAIKRRDDHGVAKVDARGRARETDKNETGNDREPKHAEHDLNRR